MNFVSCIIEGIEIIEQIYGSNSKAMKSFQKVVQGYAIKRTKTREDIKIKFEQITKEQTTDRTTNKKIQEILYWMAIYI